LNTVDQFGIREPDLSKPVIEHCDSCLVQMLKAAGLLYALECRLHSREQDSYMHPRPCSIYILQSRTMSLAKRAVHELLIYSLSLYQEQVRGYRAWHTTTSFNWSGLLAVFTCSRSSTFHEHLDASSHLTGITSSRHLTIHISRELDPSDCYKL
jgi:hypothetical protein